MTALTRGRATLAEGQVLAQPSPFVEPARVLSRSRACAPPTDSLCWLLILITARLSVCESVFGARLLRDSRCLSF